MKLVTVFRSYNMMEAEQVRARLDASDFHTSTVMGLSALGMDDFASKSGGILIQVPEEESADALELISSSSNGEETVETK